MGAEHGKETWSKSGRGRRRDKHWEPCVHRTVLLFPVLHHHWLLWGKPDRKENIQTSTGSREVCKARSREGESTLNHSWNCFYQEVCGWLQLMCVWLVPCPCPGCHHLPDYELYSPLVLHHGRRGLQDTQWCAGVQQLCAVQLRAVLYVQACLSWRQALYVSSQMKPGQRTTADPEIKHPFYSLYTAVW